MKNNKRVWFVAIVSLCACVQHTGGEINTLQTNIPDWKPEASIKAVAAPVGYMRQANTEGSFAHYLQNIALKKDKTVYLFDGRKKSNQQVQYAVLDISVGNKDLQQCADAVMRLRAEYLYSQQKFSQIEFITGARKKLNYAQWLHGNANSRKEFMKYLDYVFSYCGTASLPYSLKQKSMNQMQPGDVLLKPGSPGHAVIVVDMAVNSKGQKLYLLAQSYMPAQDIHILRNPVNEKLSPWYELNDDIIIETPEWEFYNDQLYGWP